MLSESHISCVSFNPEYHSRPSASSISFLLTCEKLGSRNQVEKNVSWHTDILTLIHLFWYQVSPSESSTGKLPFILKIVIELIFFSLLPPSGSVSQYFEVIHKFS